MSSIIKVDTIQNQSGANIISESSNTITVGASGDTITVPGGSTFNVNSAATVTGAVTNTPALKVTLTGASQTGLTSATYNKVQFNTNDTGVTKSGTWDGTNYRWTPAVAGDYFLSLNLEMFPETDTAKQAMAIIYKNGTGIVSGYINMNAMYLRNGGSNIVSCAVIDTANTTDYYEAYAYLQTNTGTFAIRGFGYDSATNFSAYKLIGV